MNPPFPTKTRLAFADEVAAGRIRWYNFVTPQAFHTIKGWKYTAALDEFVAAGLAVVPPCPEGHSSIAELNDAGRDWVARAKSRDEAGPGSTSPEPGPTTEDGA